jgi:hypothetical protein
MRLELRNSLTPLSLRGNREKLGQESLLHQTRETCKGLRKVEEA